MFLTTVFGPNELMFKVVADAPAIPILYAIVNPAYKLVTSFIVPVQVPATKIVYHDYEDETATDFNVYTYLLYAYTKDGFNIIKGQNIGNGIIIGAKGSSLSYLSVIEGAEECGGATFNEIYPA